MVWEGKSPPPPVDKLTWPAASPDLNLIEQIWAYDMKEEYWTESIKRRKKKINPVASFEEIWNNLSVEFLSSYFESMPKRMKAVRGQMGRNAIYIYIYQSL